MKEMKYQKVIDFIHMDSWKKEGEMKKEVRDKIEKHNQNIHLI
jgi:hypothetical protein